MSAPALHCWVVAAAAPACLYSVTQLGSTHSVPGTVQCDPRVQLREVKQPVQTSRVKWLSRHSIPDCLTLGLCFPPAPQCQVPTPGVGGITGRLLEVRPHSRPAESGSELYQDPQEVVCTVKVERSAALELCWPPWLLGSGAT